MSLTVSVQMSRPETLAVVPEVAALEVAVTVDSVALRLVTHTRTSRAAVIITDPARVDTTMVHVRVVIITDPARVDTTMVLARVVIITDPARADTTMVHARAVIITDPAKADTTMDRADLEWVARDQILASHVQVILEIPRQWAETRDLQRNRLKERSRFIPARTRSRLLARQSFTETRRRKPHLQA